MYKLKNLILEIFTFYLPASFMTMIPLGANNLNLDARPQPSDIPRMRIEKGQNTQDKKFLFERDFTTGYCKIEGEAENDGFRISSLYLRQHIPKNTARRFYLFGNKECSAEERSGALSLKLRPEGQQLIFKKGDISGFPSWKANLDIEPDTIKIEIKLSSELFIKEGDTLSIPFGILIANVKGASIDELNLEQKPQYSFRAEYGWNEEGDTIIKRPIFYGVVRNLDFDDTLSLADRYDRINMFLYNQWNQLVYPKEVILDTFNDEHNPEFNYPHFFYIPLNFPPVSLPTGDRFKRAGKILWTQNRKVYGILSIEKGSVYFDDIYINRQLWISQKKDTVGFAEIRYSFDEKERIFKANQGIDLFLQIKKENRKEYIQKNLQRHENENDWFGMQILDGGRTLGLYSLNRDSLPNILFFNSVFKPDTTTNVRSENNIKGEYRAIIYPNPASDYIEINSSMSLMNNLSFPSNRESIIINIYNTLGECVIDITPTPLLSGEVLRIDVSHLPSGVYLLQIREQTAMFIKM